MENTDFKEPSQLMRNEFIQLMKIYKQVVYEGDLRKALLSSRLKDKLRHYYTYHYSNEKEKTSEAARIEECSNRHLIPPIFASEASVYGSSDVVNETISTEEPMEIEHFNEEPMVIEEITHEEAPISIEMEDGQIFSEKCYIGKIDQEDEQDSGDKLIAMTVKRSDYPNGEDAIQQGSMYYKNKVENSNEISIINMEICEAYKTESSMKDDKDVVEELSGKSSNIKAYEYSEYAFSIEGNGNTDNELQVASPNMEKLVDCGQSIFLEDKKYITEELKGMYSNIKRQEDLSYETSIKDIKEIVEELKKEISDLKCYEDCKTDSTINDDRYAVGELDRISIDMEIQEECAYANDKLKSASSNMDRHNTFKRETSMENSKDTVKELKETISNMESCEGGNHQTSVKDYENTIEELKGTSSIIRKEDDDGMVNMEYNENFEDSMGFNFDK